MSAKFRAAASHGLMAYLLALGMALTLLGVTGLLQHGFLAAGTLLLLTGALTVMALNRKIALVMGSVALFGGMVWLMIGGAGVIVEVVRALILHMSGLTTALPMVGAAFTVMGCVLCAAASWFVTQRSAGAVPALILLVLIAALLWLGDLADSFVCLLPAVLACVTLLLRAGDDHTSTARVLPLAAAVTAIAFAGVMAGGAVSAPLKKAAENLRQRIYDTFFYTQPRDVFTLATEGWYPQGIGQLGGPADPHDQPVMAVITPKKVYLRGVVKNTYTGRTWVDGIGGRRYLMSATRFEELRTAAFDQDLPLLDAVSDTTLLTPRTLQVRMLRDSASTLFVPQRLRQITAEGSLMPYFNRSSEVFATSNLEVGDVWTVEAPLFTSADSGMAALVNAADSATDPRWEAVCQDYLQLPEHLQPEVFELAQAAVSGAGTPYAKAMALQYFLAANYAYNLDVPEQNPEQDFVSTFLIVGKEGYCTYFASAMTIMCRMVGLPARYVEGYVAYPDETGLAVVTGKEGHAWTEVYFRGFGWVPFDATPTSVEYSALPPEDESNGADTPENTPESENTPEPSALPEEEPTPTPAPSDAPTELPAPSAAPNLQPGESDQTMPVPPSGAPWKWVLTVLLLLLAALRVALVQPDVQAKLRQSEFRRWLAYTQAVYDALRAMGFIRDKAESPAHFLARAERSGMLPISLREFAAAQNLMFYGHAAPYAEETAQARENFRGLYRGLSLWQKVIFQLRRICLPAALRGEIAK